MINIGLVRLCFQQWPEIGRGATKFQLIELNMMKDSLQNYYPYFGKRDGSYSTDLRYDSLRNSYHYSEKRDLKERNSSNYSFLIIEFTVPETLKHLKVDA